MLGCVCFSRRRYPTDADAWITSMCNASLDLASLGSVATCAYPEVKAGSAIDASMTLTANRATATLSMTNRQASVQRLARDIVPIWTVTQVRFASLPTQHHRRTAACAPHGAPTMTRVQWARPANHRPDMGSPLSSEVRVCPTETASIQRAGRPTVGLPPAGRRPGTTSPRPQTSTPIEHRSVSPHRSSAAERTWPVARSG